jgi:hypothetical protein
MNEPAKKSFFNVQVTKSECELKHFAANGAGPGWMLCAHFIDKLPSILASAGVLLASAVASIKMWS